MDNITTLPGSRTLEFMTEDQLLQQTSDLLQLLIAAFRSGNYEDITRPEYADTLAMLRDISASRAEQGFNPSETATFVFSFKDALLEYLQEEYGESPERLNTEVIRLSKLIDQLGLVTFETYALTREEVISQQSQSLLELSTPVIQLWHEIVLLPLIGVIDTARASQIIERSYTRLSSPSLAWPSSMLLACRSSTPAWPNIWCAPPVPPPWLARR